MTSEARRVCDNAVADNGTGFGGIVREREFLRNSAGDGGDAILTATGNFAVIRYRAVKLQLVSARWISRQDTVL